MISEQRRRNLEARIREGETRRAILEAKIMGAGSSTLPEWSHELAALEQEIEDAQAEINAGIAGDAQTQAYRRATDALSHASVEMQHRMTALERKLDNTRSEDMRDRLARQEAVDERFDGIDDRISGVDRHLAELREELRWFAYAMVGVLVIFVVIVAVVMVFFR